MQNNTKYNVYIDSEWNGIWFPHKPEKDDPLLSGHNNVVNNNIDSSYTKKMKTMGITDPTCDDAEVLNKTIARGYFSLSFFATFSTQIISINIFSHFFFISYSFSPCHIQQNLWIDYDPKNISHHSRYLCIQNRKQFEPNTNIEPILREYIIPVEYSVNIIDNLIKTLNCIVSIIGIICFSVYFENGRHCIVV